MAGFSVPASSNGLPLKVATATNPAYARRPIASGNPNPLPVGTPAQKLIVTGNVQPPTATLPVNQGNVYAVSPVAIPGVQTIRPVALGVRSGPKPGANQPGNTGAQTSGGALLSGAAGGHGIISVGPFRIGNSRGIAL